MEKNRPKIGIGILIRNNDKFLLLKRKNVHGNGTWAPPGGHLELGESVIECAKRETLEEVNVVIENVKIVTITEDIFDVERHYITIWVAADYTGTIKNNEPEKCDAVEWFSEYEFPNELFLSFKNLLRQKALDI